jgi:hypothetical protein
VLGRALDLLECAGSAEACITRLAGVAEAEPASLAFQSRFGRLRVSNEDAASPTRPDSGAAALALEMALHEEAERRAMEEELTALRSAWEEAELIATIADALPDDPLDRLARAAENRD